jgi:hypothetical protein
MLNDQSCKDVHAELIKYRAKLIKQKDKTEKAFKVVTDWFETIKHLLDIQRQWAYAAAYNTACSSERNGESSFIDLDTINKILPPSEAKTVTVTKNDELVEDCADVKANGSEDLVGFKVSMKKAKGTDFQLQWDPYGVPDQVIVKAQNGSVLYDSGCKGSENAKAEDMNMKVPLAKLTGDKNIFITVNNNCADPQKTKNASSWEVGVKCAQEDINHCVQPKQELADLLVKEVEYYKKYMDANATERYCLEHFDENILKEMEEYGLFIQEGGTMTNGFCETLDEECLNQQLLNALNEKPVQPQVFVIPLRIPSATVVEESCSEKPDETESIFKLVSWNYCMHAQKRLELGETSKE